MYISVVLIQSKTDIWIKPTLNYAFVRVY